MSAPKEFSCLKRRLCPKCRVAMVVSELKAGVRVDVCPQCRGMWLDHGELKALVEARMSERSGPEVLAEAERTEFNCPDCEQPLFRRLFERGSDIWIEQCSRCAGIFLDVGELKGVDDFLRAAGLKYGTDNGQ